MTMHRLPREAFLKSRFLPLWGLLGFQAGFINSFGFLACQRFVSHVTGFGTQVGMSIGAGQYAFAIEMLGAPFFFIFGSFTSACLTVVREERGLPPRYDGVIGLMPWMILACAVLGFAGVFGPFTETLLLPRDFVLLFSLSLICGMQNGCFTTMSHGQIRTTHLTGISTDFGTDLARSVFGRLEGGRRALVLQTNRVRMMTFFAFSLGAVLSAFMENRLGYLGLGIPVVTSTVVWIFARRVKREIDHDRGLLTE